MLASAKAVTARNTMSRGISTGSSQATHAESPAAPSSNTSAGVKQQIAVMTLPTMPIPSSFFARILAPALVAIAVLACSASPSQYTRSEPGAFVVRCDQSDLRWNACYDKASRLCGEAGYSIVREPDGGAPDTTVNIHEVPVIGDSMVIRCN